MWLTLTQRNRTMELTYSMMPPRYKDGSRRLSKTRTIKLPDPKLLEIGSEMQLLTIDGFHIPWRIVESTNNKTVIDRSRRTIAVVPTASVAKQVKWAMKQLLLPLAQRLTDMYVHILKQQRWGKQDFTYDVKVTDAAKTKWGSCCSRRNRHFSIRFSYLMLLGDWNFLKYVAAHEVSHIQVMEHNEAFWKTVDALMPDWMHHDTNYCPDKCEQIIRLTKVWDFFSKHGLNAPAVSRIAQLYPKPVDQPDNKPKKTRTRYGKSKRSRRCIYRGVEFDSITLAGEHFNVTRQTVHWGLTKGNLGHYLQ